MTRTLDRWLPAMTLLSWSVILIYFHQSGRLTAFLHPNFRPGVMIAGCVLLALGVIALWAGGAEQCEIETCGHSFARSTRGKLLAFAVLLLPTFLAVSMKEDGFGATAIANRGVALDGASLGPAPGAADAMDFVPEKEDGFAVLSVVDLLFAAQEPTLRSEFEGQSVQLVGQLMTATEGNPNGNRMKVIRMFMSCCAADARPVGALVEFQQLPQMPELSWVKVRGVVQFPIEGGRNLALLKVSSIEPTSPPDETMLFY